MNVPLISVIIPIFNIQDYLEQCVNSVKCQTIKDIEIILINDGSTDNSGKIADELSSIDSRIKVIHKTNGGPSTARNAGLSIAKGKYISFIDSDDWVEENFLECLYFLAVKDDADIVVTGITVEFIKEHKIEKLKYPKEKCTSNNNNFGLLFWELQKLRLANYPVTKLYKKSFLLENGITFQTDISIWEDLIFNLKAFKKANVICINNLAPYHYMKREIATLTSSYNPNFMNATQKQLAAYEDFINHFDLKEDEHKNYLNALYIKSYSGLLGNLFKKNNPFTFKERVKIIKTEIFSNKILIEHARSIKLKGRLNKLFTILIVKTNAFCVIVIYSLLFFFRNKFEYIYLKFRYLLRK